MNYRHTQSGTWIIALFGGMAVLSVGVALASAPPTRWILLGFTLLLGVLMALFHSLTVEIESGRLEVRFGIGWIRRRFDLADVRDARVVRNRWYYGWGVRLTPSGWMFNLSGLDAVELTLASGRRFRIGSDEAEVLCEAIRAGVK